MSRRRSFYVANPPTRMWGKHAARNLAALGKPVTNGRLPVELEPMGSTVKQEAGIEESR